MLARQAQMENQHKADLDEEERIQRNIEKQILAAMALERENHGNDDDEKDDEIEEGLHREEGEGKKIQRIFSCNISFLTKIEKISLSLVKRSALHDRGNFFTTNETEDTSGTSSTKRQKTLPFDENAEDLLSTMRCHPIPSSTTSTSTTTTTNTPKSALQLLMEEEEQRKQLTAKKLGNATQRILPSDTQQSHLNELPDIRLPNWLHRGIVVKILNKRLANGRYYKMKGVVEDITGDGYVGILRILPIDDDDEIIYEKIKIDQEELETVIPQVGKDVLILNGIGRGCRGLLTKITEESYTCDVRITEGRHSGRILENMEYEDISKLY